MMPSNYRRFAARRAEGKAVDLWTDSKAILNSTADFLRDHGWVKGGPVMIEAEVQDGTNIAGSDRFTLDDTLDGLRAKGVRVDSMMPGSTPAVLIEAALESSEQYRVGFKNFYVIGRYNPRVNYAMAVRDLAQELRCKLLGCIRSHDAEIRPLGDDDVATSIRSVAERARKCWFGVRGRFRAWVA